MQQQDRITLTRYLSTQEFTDLNQTAMDVGKYNTDPSVFTPGMMWEMSWYFDPTGERERLGKHVMYKLADREAILSGKKKTHTLSMYYWRDWSHICPPRCVICPNESLWEIDRLSSNGNGWKVTGQFPKITCNPSIDLWGYHGWLQDGVFSYDLNGRGPRGISRRTASTSKQ